MTWISPKDAAQLLHYDVKEVSLLALNKAQREEFDFPRRCGTFHIQTVDNRN